MKEKIEQVKEKLLDAALRALDSSDKLHEASGLINTFVMLERETRSGFAPFGAPFTNSGASASD